MGVQDYKGHIKYRKNEIRSDELGTKLVEMAKALQLIVSLLLAQEYLQSSNYN